MRRSAVFLMGIVAAVASCQPPGSGASTTASLTVALDTPTARPSDTSPPPTPWPTAAPEPFYRIRIEYSTTSDWSSLEVLSTEHVLTTRLVATEGEPTSFDVGLPMISLNQPIADAEAGHRVGLTVDLALEPDAATSTLDLQLKKGNIGGSAIRVMRIHEGESLALAELRHDGIVAGSGGLNPAAFAVDLAPLADLAPEVVPSGAGAFPRLLWAFYYPWYTRADWSSPTLRDRPPEPYDSADRATIERHVRQAKDAGIDGFISSWWGPGSDTDANLRTLLDVAQEQDFLVTIYFETLTGEGHLSPSEIVRWMTYALRTYGDHPAFARVDGKPVIVLWASGALPLGSWEGALTKVRASGLDVFTLGMGYSLANLEVFDGLHDYGVFTLPELEQTVVSIGRGVRHYNLLQEDPGPKLWAATVQPGYDDRLIPGRDGLVQERDAGAFYRRTWEAALASDPNWIFITTWNEWWESTHIEPSQDFGELYLDLTREYAGVWKGK